MKALYKVIYESAPSLRESVRLRRLIWNESLDAAVGSDDRYQTIKDVKIELRDFDEQNTKPDLREEIS